MPPSRSPHARNGFRLLTLGSTTLVDAGGRSVVQQRRCLALLALLAASGERGVTRDRLVVGLSPESTADSARHALPSTELDLQPSKTERPSAFDLGSACERAAAGYVRTFSATRVTPQSSDRHRRVTPRPPDLWYDRAAHLGCPGTDLGRKQSRRFRSCAAPTRCPPVLSRPRLTPRLSPS